MTTKNFLLIILLLLPFSLTAEILTLELRWTPGLCQNTCPDFAQRKLSEITGVESVVVNGSQGQATIKWSDSKPFSWKQVSDPIIAGIGLSIRNSSVQVTGNIIRLGKFYGIRSSGDNTLFYLIGQIEPNLNEYVVQKNLEDREYPPNIREQLEEAVLGKYAVEIRGPLFMPWRYQRLYVIVSGVKKLKESEEDKE